MLQTRGYVDQGDGWGGQVGQGEGPQGEEQEPQEEEEEDWPGEGGHGEGKALRHPPDRPQPGRTPDGVCRPPPGTLQGVENHRWVHQQVILEEI